MYKKACKVVDSFAYKNYCFFSRPSLPSASLDLKVPNNILLQTSCNHKI